jgi:hypothetical protein
MVLNPWTDVMMAGNRKFFYRLFTLETWFAANIKMSTIFCSKIVIFDMPISGQVPVIVAVWSRTNNFFYLQCFCRKALKHKMALRCTTGWFLLLFAFLETHSFCVVKNQQSKLLWKVLESNLDKTETTGETAASAEPAHYSSLSSSMTPKRELMDSGPSKKLGASSQGRASSGNEQTRVLWKAIKS